MFASSKNLGTDGTEMNDNDQTLKGVWLVQMKTPEYGQEGREIQHIFKSAQMRFDSLVFTFYTSNMGKMIKLLI